METLIGTLEVTYEEQPPELHFFHLIGGYMAARFDGEEVAQFKALLGNIRKRIVQIGDTYRIITGAGDDLSIYHGPSGRRMVYLNNDEVAALRRMLGVTLNASQEKLR